MREVAERGMVLDLAHSSPQVVSDTLDMLGGLVNPLVEEVSDITTDLQMLPICLNARTMLNSDTVVLR